MLYNDFSFSLRCCSCHSSNHLVTQCPRTHLIFDKDFIIKRFKSSKDQNREFSQRKIRFLKKFPTIKNLKKTQTAIEHYNEKSEESESDGIEEDFDGFPNFPNEDGPTTSNPNIELNDDIIESENIEKNSLGVMKKRKMSTLSPRNKRELVFMEPDKKGNTFSEKETKEIKEEPKIEGSTDSYSNKASILKKTTRISIISETNKALFPKISEGVTPKTPNPNENGSFSQIFTNNSSNQIPTRKNEKNFLLYQSDFETVCDYGKYFSNNNHEKVLANLKRSSLKRRRKKKL